MQNDLWQEAVQNLRDHNLSNIPVSPPVHTFSPHFEQAMKKIIRDERKSHWQVFSTYSKRAAVVLLSASISLCAMLSVGAWSRDFLKMMTQRFPDHTEITFQESGEGVASSEDILYEISYIPEGFRRVQHLEDVHFNHAYFEDDAKHNIAFSQNLATNTTIGLNTEGADMEEISFKDGTAQILSNRGFHIVLWYDDKYCFMVDSNISREETLKIANSVRIKAKPYSTLQEIPIESLPESYTEKLALENGDVIFGKGAPKNIEKLDQFIADCEANKDSAVRLASYTADGSPLIIDMQMQDGHLYYTRDEHRWEDSEQPWNKGEEYERISVLEAGGKKTILLHTYHYEEPETVIEYETTVG